MEYIHVKNLEKYNPGYTDRSLIWCKIYFSMLNSSYDFEQIDDIDKWRFIALVMLELQMKKPIPYDEKWLQRKISINPRPISLTIQMLHNFIERVTDSSARAYHRVEKSRVDKSREEKNRKDVENSLLLQKLMTLKKTVSGTEEFVALITKEGINLASARKALLTSGIKI